MGIRRILALASFLVITGSLFGQRNANPVEANKKIVVDFYRYVWEPKDDQALMNWLPESYLEHNPMFPGGRADLANFLKSRRTGPPAKVADKLTDPPELIVAEGDLVTWIFKRARKDPKDNSKTYDSFWFDTFRIKDRKIVEHWDGATRDMRLGAQ